jgi:hypothetical protein
MNRLINPSTGDAAMEILQLCAKCERMCVCVLVGVSVARLKQRHQHLTRLRCHAGEGGFPTAIEMLPVIYLDGVVFV